MTDKILKRLAFFLIIVVLSFFLPWQITVLLFIVIAILLPAPIEYAFLAVGIFGAGLFVVLWGALVVAGLMVRAKTTLNQNFLR